jgi:agmatinase
VAANPFEITGAIKAIEEGAEETLGSADRLLTLGGDHTIALPLLRVAARRHGPVAVLHFDAHLDTWDTYFGEPYTHGTPFRRASEEGLIDANRSLHVGIRGPLYADTDLVESGQLGYATIACTDYDRLGLDGVLHAARDRLGDGPVYVSVDIDVIDPGMAPGTGTPEAGGLTSRELLATLRGLAGLDIVGADIVEVAPAYDHAEVTGIAAAHVGYELLSAMARYA